jgi:hypothetical protein
MIFDIDKIKDLYSGLKERVEKTRLILGRPITYTEKILYAHSDLSELILPISDRTELQCRMQLLKWLCFSLCPQI